MFCLLYQNAETHRNVETFWKQFWIKAKLSNSNTFILRYTPVLHVMNIKCTLYKNGLDVLELMPQLYIYTTEHRVAFSLNL